MTSLDVCRHHDDICESTSESCTSKTCTSETCTSVTPKNSKNRVSHILYDSLSYLSAINVKYVKEYDKWFGGDVILLHTHVTPVGIANVNLYFNGTKICLNMIVVDSVVEFVLLGCDFTVAYNKWLRHN